MKRRLFTILSALSLLLFVAVAAMSIWTLNSSVVILRAWRGAAQPHSVAALVSGRGGVGIVCVNDPLGDYDEGGWSVSHPPPQYGGVDWPQISRHSWAGFHFANTKIGPERIVGLCAPVWFLLPVLLALPLLWLRHHRLRKRNRPGLCPTCGYDLRATPDRCPECGAFPAMASA